MFRLQLGMIACLAALMGLPAAAAAQTRLCKLGVEFTCQGDSGGKLGVTCRAGETGGPCCARVRKATERLCKSSSGPLNKYQCAHIFGPGSPCIDSDQTGTPPFGPVRPLARPCARIKYEFQCAALGRRIFGSSNCRAGESRSACCVRREQELCRNLNTSSVCKCLDGSVLQRRR